MRVATFWSVLLDRQITQDDSAITVAPEDQQTTLHFEFGTATHEVRPCIHLDLTTDHLEQDVMVARALELGARPLNVGQRGDEGHVVLADPDGNEFCVLPPGNRFLAGCGPVGGLSCDGSRQVGEFWSAALDWPLVWDEGEETAVQPPGGGPKVAWGGPPLMPLPRVSPVRFEIDLGTNTTASADRLLALGAQRHPARTTTWIDPGGHEFSMVAVD